MKRKVIKVIEDGNLVICLTKNGFAKNKAKTLVKLGVVYVNNNKVCKLPFNVVSGDIVVIDKCNNKKELDIIYEDSNYLIVNKRNGMLTISTSTLNKNKEETLYRLVREYLNSKKEKAFIVNRIDKETSGLVVFVKNIKLKEKLQSNWNDIVKERKYIAVVSGVIKKDGRIDNYLYEDKLTFSHSTKIGGKRAITNYRVIEKNKKYTMIDINIETGRKNQIRVHMMEMGYPIVGDKKYCCKDNTLHRLCLHHYKISFVDPISKRLKSFESDIPNEFYSLFDNY